MGKMSQREENKEQTGSKSRRSIKRKVPSGLLDLYASNNVAFPLSLFLSSTFIYTSRFFTIQRSSILLPLLFCILDLPLAYHSVNTFVYPWKLKTLREFFHGYYIFLYYFASCKELFYTGRIEDIILDGKWKKLYF